MDDIALILALLAFSTLMYTIQLVELEYGICENHAARQRKDNFGWFEIVILVPVVYSMRNLMVPRILQNLFGSPLKKLHESDMLDLTPTNQQWQMKV